MSLIRKAFWPSAIALSLLVFLGAAGVGVKPAYADPEVVGICGPEVISEDEVALYVAIFEDYDGPVIADLNSNSGDADITSATLQGGYEDIGPVDFWDFVHAVDLWSGDDEDIRDDLEDEFGFDVEECFETLGIDPFEDLEDRILEGLTQCIDEGDDNCDGDDGDIGDADGPDIVELAEFVAALIASDPDEFLGNSCYDELHDALENWLIQNFYDPVDFDEDDIADFANNFCDVFTDFDLIDAHVRFSIAAVDVTCEEPGEFDLTFLAHTVPRSGKGGLIEVTCVGDIDEAIITATPNKVEIVPALGSVSYSLIVVELLDEDGEPIVGGVTVDFTTDRCEFLDEDGLTEEEFELLADVFADYSVNDSDYPEVLHDLVEDVEESDPDDTSNDVPSFTLDDDFGDFDEDDTIAAIILDCSDIDTVPGIAEVCAHIEVSGPDITECVDVTVIGPPASVTAVAAPATLICGEKATITVTVKDSAGQNVSDHTRVEAVTNLGGVLAGTGAVAGQAGLVVPVSSTVGETFGGVATMFLLTSDVHAGPYEVVIATGGGGSVNTGLGGVFSTPPEVTQVTVTCAQPVTASPATPAPAAPTVSAPRTGTGTIIPPSTGDGGLLAEQSSGSFSWALVAVAGVMAFSVAGLATLKSSRR